MSRVFKRNEGQLDWTANTQSRLPLSRNYHVQNYLVRLEVVHTNAASAALNDEGLWSLINSIQLVGDGSENIKQIPANKIYINNLVYSGRSGAKSISTAEGQKTSFAYGIISLSIPNTVRPHDTILNTAVFQSLDMIVDWGGTIGTNITVDNAKMTVMSNQLIGYKRNDGETIKYFKEMARKEAITATTTEFEIDMPTKKLYKSFTIAAFVDGKRSEDVIKGIKLKSGTTVIMEWRAEDLNAFNKLSYGVENDEDFKGIYVVDMCERGKLTDMLNTITNFNSLEFVLDVEKQVGNNFVLVHSDFVEQTQVTEK